MLTLPRITVEVPVLGISSALSSYEDLGMLVDAPRRRQGLHLTLLHIGVLDDFSRDVEDWTKGITSRAAATRRVVSWVESLPVLAAFTGRADKLIVMGGGNICGLEVEVPEHVHQFQILLVRALHELLDDLLVDNVDDFILSSRALGFRHPRWTPHVAIGRPKARAREPLRIEPVFIDFGSSRIRNYRFLPAVGPS